jgi:hypothetical protein
MDTEQLAGAPHCGLGLYCGYGLICPVHEEARRWRLRVRGQSAGARLVPGTCGADSPPAAGHRPESGSLVGVGRDAGCCGRLRHTAWSL